jgi:hypothetical protein
VQPRRDAAGLLAVLAEERPIVRDEGATAILLFAMQLGKGLDEAKLELQRARATSMAQAAELRAQHQQLQQEALRTAERCSTERREAQALTAANADAREQLVATQRLLQQLQAESLEKRQRCEQLTHALGSAQQLLEQSHAKLQTAEGGLKPPYSSSPKRSAAAGSLATDASRAIAALLMQTVEGASLPGAAQQLPQPAAPDPTRVSERMARVRSGRPSNGRPGGGAYARPATAPAAERDLGV